MAGGATPMNQLNSLPIVTAAQWITSVVVAPETNSGVTVGGKLLKQWGPAATGINNTVDVVDPRAAAGSYWVTNWLDVSGLEVLAFSLVLRATAAINDVLKTYDVYAYPLVELAGVAVPLDGYGAGNAHNMTQSYGNTAFPHIGQLVAADLMGGGNMALNDVKVCSFACRLGIPAPGFGSCPPTGIVQFWGYSTVAIEANLSNYLTIWGQG